VIGTSAGSFTNPASGAKGDGIRVVTGALSGTVRSNLIGFAGGNGIGMKGVGAGWLLEGNEIRGNGLDNPDWAGVFLENTTGLVTIRGNLLAGNRGAGVDAIDGVAAHVLENNTLTGNGTGGTVTAGVRLKKTVGGRVDRNVIYGNTGAGVIVNKAAATDTITKNSIFGNTSIGIDLDSGDNDTGDGVTLNDLNDLDSGGNGRLNFPILQNATVSGTTLTLTGFARPGSAIELFIADPDPTGFGEGRTYLVTLTEGSVVNPVDNNATTGSYTNPVNGLNQGADTTNRFRFDIPLPPGAGIGAQLTATATLGGSTSEFSGMVTIAGSALQQVDSMIKLASEAAGGYLTDDLYEAIASAQSKPSGVVSGSTATYNVLFQNDGNVADNVVITGTGSGPGFTVQYLDNTATDRTADVTGAGYTIGGLAPGLSKVWTLNVTPAGTVVGGTSYDVFVTTVSGTDNTKIDQVKAVTTSTSASLTLLKSADKGAAAPGEDITYTVNASNGLGLTAAGNVAITDPLDTNTGFKVGGATFNAGDSTLSFTVVYSNDNRSTWTYIPASGGCGAPVGYDDCVTDVRWTTTGSMPTGTGFSVGLVVRVK